MRAITLTPDDLRAGAARAWKHPRGHATAYLLLPSGDVTSEVATVRMLRSDPALESCGDPVVAIVVRRGVLLREELKAVLDKLIDFVPGFLDRLEEDPRDVARALLAKVGSTPELEGWR